MTKPVLTSNSIPLLLRVAESYAGGTMLDSYKEVTERPCIGAQRLAMWRLLTMRPALTWEQLPIRLHQEQHYQYRFKYCYCAKCKTVHDSTAGFSDYITLSCLTCEGSRKLTVEHKAGKYYPVILPVAQAVMQFSFAECELLDSFLKSLQWHLNCKK